MRINKVRSIIYGFAGRAFCKAEYQAQDNVQNAEHFVEEEKVKSEEEKENSTMVSEKITVKNPSGLHLRPAGILSNIASKCVSDVTLVKGDKRVNPKSVLVLMAAGIKCGDEITVECSGETEADDLKTIIDAIASGLGE